MLTTLNGTLSQRVNDALYKPNYDYLLQMDDERKSPQPHDYHCITMA